MYAKNNGWKYDIDVYQFRGRVWFRLWNGQFDADLYSAETLGL